MPPESRVRAGGGGGTRSGTGWKWPRATCAVECARGD
jgi:hypothetical protein